MRFGCNRNFRTNQGKLKAYANVKSRKTSQSTTQARRTRNSGAVAKVGLCVSCEEGTDVFGYNEELCASMPLGQHPVILRENQRRSDEAPLQILLIDRQLARS